MSVHQLTLPEGLEDENESVEIIRMFIGDSDSLISLYDFCGEPRQWGMVLADLANHVADMYSQLDHGTQQDILKEVKKGYSGRMEEFYNLSGRILPSKD